MSRTKRGSKPPGFEYWSKRAGNKHGGLLGSQQKKFTARMERHMKINEEDWGV